MTISATLAATVIGKLGDERSRKLALVIPFVGLLVADASLMLQAYFVEVNHRLVGVDMHLRISSVALLRGAD